MLGLAVEVCLTQRVSKRIAVHCVATCRLDIGVLQPLAWVVKPATAALGQRENLTKFWAHK